MTTPFCLFSIFPACFSAPPLDDTLARSFMSVPTSADGKEWFSDVRGLLKVGHTLELAVRCVVLIGAPALRSYPALYFFPLQSGGTPIFSERPPQKYFLPCFPLKTPPAARHGL